MPWEHLRSVGIGDFPIAYGVPPWSAKAFFLRFQAAG
jgi:hypothetical protein